MRIGYIASNANFGGRLIDALDARDHEVIIYRHQATDTANWYQLGQVQAQADMVFVDWAQDPLSQVLANFACPVYCKAHRIEMYNAEREQWPWANCDALIFVAKFVANRYMAGLKQQTPRRVVVVPHAGIDTEKFTPGDARSWEPPWTILVAGNIVPKKRQYTVLQAMLDLPEEFHMTLVGRGGHLPGYGNAEYVQNCNDFVNSHPDVFTDRFESHEWLPQTPADVTPEDVAAGRELSLLDLYQRSHIIVNASNEESSSCVLAEGMAAGMYPAANRWRGFGELYPEWAGWDSPGAYVRTLEEWAALPAEDKQNWSDRAREWIVEKHSATRVDEQMVALLESPTHPVASREYYLRDPERAEAEEGAALAGDKPDLLREYAQGRLLDLGCGRGWGLEVALEAGCALAEGQDVWEGGCIAADERTPEGMDTYQADVTGTAPNMAHGLAEGPWDTVAALDLFDHLRPKHWGQVLGTVADRSKRIIVTFERGRGPDDLDARFREQVIPKTFANAVREAGFDDVILSEPIDDDTRWAIVAEQGGA